MKNEYKTGKTCASCVRGKLSSQLSLCVECLRKDAPGNRFPNWGKNNEQVIEKLD